MIIAIDSTDDFEKITSDGKNIFFKNNSLVLEDSRTAPSYYAIKRCLSKSDHTKFTDWLIGKYGNPLSKAMISFEADVQSESFVNLMKKHYCVKRTDCDLQVFMRTSLTNNKVKVLTNPNDGNATWKKVAFHMKHNISNNGIVKSMNEPKLLQKIEECIGSRILDMKKDIVKFSNSAGQFTYSYWNEREFIKQMKTPAWDSFLSSFELESEKELLLAFFYSIFKADNLGRQILWLKGCGDTGKSRVVMSVINLLKSIGDKLVKSLPSDKYIDKFTFSNVDKARLIVVSDTKDKNLLANDQILQITGGDEIAVRGMYKEADSKQVHAKIICISNILPVLNINNEHEITRMLLICMDDNLAKKAFIKWEMERPESNWNDLIIKELPGMLYNGKIAYKKYVNRKDNFNIPDDMMNKIRINCSTDECYKFDIFFKHFCITGVSYSTPEKVFIDGFKKFIGNNLLKNSTKEYIAAELKKHDVSIRRSNVNVNNTVGNLLDNIMLKQPVLTYPEFIQQKEAENVRQPDTA